MVIRGKRKRGNGSTGPGSVFFEWPNHIPLRIVWWNDTAFYYGKRVILKWILVLPLLTKEDLSLRFTSASDGLPVDIWRRLGMVKGWMAWGVVVFKMYSEWKSFKNIQLGRPHAVDLACCIWIGQYTYNHGWWHR